jgi:hypothetical protein
MIVLDSRQPAAPTATFADLSAIPFPTVTSLLGVTAIAEVLNLHVPSPPGVSTLATVVLRI